MITIFYRDGRILQKGGIFGQYNSTGYDNQMRWKVGDVTDSGFYYTELLSGRTGYSDSTSAGETRLDWILVSGAEKPQKTGFSKFITTNQL